MHWVCGAGSDCTQDCSREHLPLSESEGGHAPHLSGKTGDVSCHRKPALPTTSRGLIPDVGAAGASAEPGGRRVNVAVWGGATWSRGVSWAAGGCAHVKGLSRNPLRLVQRQHNVPRVCGVCLARSHWGLGSGRLGVEWNPYTLNGEQKCYRGYPSLRETFGDQGGQYFHQHRPWEVMSLPKAIVTIR